MKAPNNWFDTKESIVMMLDNLRNLRTLILARQEAFRASKYGEVFTKNFVILGRFELASKDFIILNPPPIEKFPLIPPILTWEEYTDFTGPSLHISRTKMDAIPNDTVLCQECGQGWNIHNLEDSKVISDQGWFGLYDFVGSKIEDIEITLERGRNRIGYIIWRIAKGQCTLRNKFTWKEKIVPTSYIIEKSDHEIQVSWHEFYHRKCYKLALTRERTQKLQSYFVEAGFSNIIIELVERRSLSDGVADLVFYARTSLGALEVVDNQVLGEYFVNGRFCGLHLPTLLKMDSWRGRESVRLDLVNIVSALTETKSVLEKKWK